MLFDGLQASFEQCIVEAKVRQEGYIQWLAQMKHREGDIDINPLQKQRRNKKFVKRWCHLGTLLIINDTEQFT